MRSRVETLVVARAFCLSRGTTPGKAGEALLRFGPLEVTESGWRATLEETFGTLREEGVLDGGCRLTDRGELQRRIGKHGVREWRQLAGKVLPGFGLGVAAEDGRVHARMTKIGWAALIVAREMGVWRGGVPPTGTALGDAIVWKELGMGGKPRTCPDELRAYFVRRRLGTDGGTYASQLRLLACKIAGAPSPGALPTALVRRWLAGKELGGGFVAEVREIARAALEGVFGDRKVFISSVWDSLQRRPQWSALGVSEFKERLVAAHRAGELVLERADLVTLMDPALVAASETTYGSTRFHFIVREAS
ncbi:MAG: hypothetical protein KIT31_08815 [Deltaproteobacteria bacterium]|nr:hypothetical protein [Deltaproteobacteria bacterium]